MSTINITRIELENAANDIMSFKQRKNNNKYFSFFLIRNIHYLTPEIESINTLKTSISTNKKVQEYDEKRVTLAKSFADKDADGNPVVKIEVTQFGQQNEVFVFSPENEQAFAKELKKLIEEYSEDLAQFEASINELNTIMSESIEIEVSKIAFDKIPDDIDISNIEKFIIEPTDEIQKIIE